jgi:hypothetical protein
MPFHLGFDSVPIRRHNRKEEGKFLRFNHLTGKWERGGQDGWVVVSVSFARTLWDKGWKVWDLHEKQ